MNLLLDSHVLLWAAGSPQRLSHTARGLLEAPEHTLHFSAASLWEIAIKAALGRPDFLVDPVLLRRRLLNNGYGEVSITGEHVCGIRNLPPLHRDPFDRLLVAQAIVEGMLLVTSDATVARYPGPIRQI